MTPDTTGHGTQDTGHVLRPARPNQAPISVPHTPSLPTPAAGHLPPAGMQDVPRPDTRDVLRTLWDTERDVPQEKEPRVLSRMVERYRTSRASRAADAEQRDMLEQASRAARDAELDRQRDAMSRAATSRRNASRARTPEQRDEAIAPIPDWMKVAGVWLDRTFGAIPLIAPLVVSGYFTMHVFTDQPLNVAWAIALCITLALEGGVWKLSRIYEKTLLEGDSTLGIRLVIALYLALISGMIYGHAYYQAWKDAGQLTDGQAAAIALDWSKWGPAAGVAVMSFLGVMVWSKQARYQHRVKLREQGQVDPRAPKFATLAWILTFRETIGSLRHSVKFRISNPEEAVNDWRLYRAAGRPPIWPIPAGFQWINGTLEMIDPLVGRDVQDALPSRTGQRPALDSTTDGTPARVINGTSRDAVPQLPAGHDGTRDTADNTGHHGAQHGTPDTAHGTGAAGEHGTRDTNGARDGHGTGERDTSKLDAELLKYADKALIVTEAFDGKDGRPHWATMPKPPAVRAIIAAIDKHRKATEGPDAGFASKDIASKVQALIIRMRETPGMVDLVRFQVAGDTPN